MRASRFVVLALFAVLVTVPTLAGEASKDAAGSAAFPSSPASVLSAMDTKADPCQDFYRYACGGWLDKTQLPPDQSRWGRGFAEIEERNREELRDILVAAAKEQGGDAGRAKLGAFYSACMEEDKVEKAGADPLKPLLKEIDDVKDAASLMAMAAKLQGYLVPVLFRVRVQGDFKNPDLAIASFSQGGLGLPDRDYYLKDDDRSKQMRADYQAHMTKMFQLLGEPEEAAKKHAGRVFNLELELAKVSRPRAEMRDPNKTYNKLDIDGLKKLTPALDWTRFLTTTGYPSVKDINVGVPEFFQGLEKQVTSTDPETLRAYLRWHLVLATAPLLSKAFQDENFDFYGKKLSGQKEQQARWKRCVEATDSSLGELLGQEFVKQYFPGDSKAIAGELIGRIEAAFEANLPSLTWMDDATRARASAKLKALKNKVGYPDKWRDYSKLAVKKGDYFASSLAARRFAFDFEENKIGKPVDKGEWGMTPPTVNAYYNPLLNEMVFPAGILQPPFFDRGFPMAMNFGGIGMVMGHELTHGFDDQGRKFDPTGKLTEWWEPSVSAKFDERAKCVSDLYSSYEVQPGVKLNGKLTLGENIADLGGIKQAFVAYKKWAKEHPETDKPVLEGMTNDQLFFVGFGQTWCSLQTPEVERMLVTTDPHSHPKYRVTGPLSNFPSFSSAFQCAEGTPMKRKDACEVW
jgi:putative endopeptidase